MAQEFSQIKDENPAFNPVTPAVKESGKVMSEVFGVAAETAEKKAEAVRKEQNDIQLMTGQNNIVDLKAKTEAAIYGNPGMAKQIAAKAREVSDTMGQGFSGENLAKFNTYKSQHIGAVEVFAARIAATTDKKILLDQFHSTFNNKLEAFKDNLGKDEGDTQSKELTDILAQASSGGLIDLDTRDKYVAQINNVLRYHQDMNIMSKGGTTAEKYNATKSISFNGSDTVSIGDPINESTNQLIDHAQQEKTFRSATQSALLNQPISPEVMQSLKPIQQDKVTHYYIGARRADGMTRSLESAPKVDARIQELDALPKSSRTAEDTGELETLQYWKKQQEIDFIGTQEKTGKGKEYAFQYNQREAVINQKHYDTLEDKNNAHFENVNEYMQNHNNMRMGNHVGADIANITPAEVRNIVAQSFTKDANTEFAVGTMNKMQGYNKYFLAKSAKTPAQKAALYGIASIQMSQPEGTAPTNEQHDIIRAAQDGKDYSILVGVDPTKDTTIGDYIKSKMQDQLNFASRIPEGNKKTSEQWQNGIEDLGIRYVKDKMIQNNDYNGDNYTKYADEFAHEYSRGFNLMNGLNYSFNANELSGFEKGDASALANYEINKWYERLVAQKGETKANQELSDNPVFVTNTRDGEIITVDRSGTVLNREWYSGGALDLAHSSERKNSEKISKELHESRMKDIVNPSAGATP